MTGIPEQRRDSLTDLKFNKQSFLEEEKVVAFLIIDQEKYKQLSLYSELVKGLSDTCLCVVIYFL